jgi:hypothetical protein
MQDYPGNRSDKERKRRTVKRMATAKDCPGDGEEV